MSTYVINNRIPRFPLKPLYAEPELLQKKVEEVFQVWLKEIHISNLVRRKACSQLYDFSCWMGDQNKYLENSSDAEYQEWCQKAGMAPHSQWGDFLVHAKRRLPNLQWR